MITAYFLYFFAMILPVLLWIATSVWTILDAEKIPAKGWTAVGENKNIWIALSILLAWPFGFALYLWLVRRHLDVFVKEQHDKEVIENYEARKNSKDNEPEDLSDSTIEESSGDENTEHEEFSSSYNSNLRNTMDELDRTPETVSYDRNTERETYTKVVAVVETGPPTELISLEDEAKDDDAKDTGPISSIPVVYPAPSSEESERVIPEQPDYRPTVQDDVDEDVETESSKEVTESDLLVTEQDEEVTEVQNKPRPYSVIPPVPTHSPTVHEGLKSKSSTDNK